MAGESKTDKKNTKAALFLEELPTFE